MVFGGGGAEAVLAYLDARLKPLLLGEDPLQVERLWEKMYRGDRGVRRVGIAGMALSALDIGAVGPRRQGSRAAALQALGRGSPTACPRTAAAAGRSTAKRT